MERLKFKLGDKVLVEGEVREIIPTCSARSPLYGVILNDGVLVAQADNDLHLDIGFSNGTESQPSWAAWIEIIILVQSKSSSSVAALLGCVD